LKTVDHNKGIFVRKEHVRGKLCVISTNGIDGTSGRLKNWIRAEGGVDSGHILAYVKEFQWMRDIGSADPLLTVMEHIRDRHFQ